MSQNLFLRVCSSGWYTEKSNLKTTDAYSGMVFTPRRSAFSTFATFGGKALGARLFYLIS